MAWDAVLSGKYDTLQFPFSSISDEKDIALAELARDHDMGFIAMKGLAGGLITNARTTFAFMKQHPWVVPIWGIQRESELQEFLELEKNPPAYDEEMKQLIARDRAELAGNFCHGCGYCQPCPVGIPIQNAARMSLLLRRSPYQSWLTDEMNAEMMKIENCLHCGACASRCPYGLDTPRLLAENLADYKQFRAEHLNK